MINYFYYTLFDPVLENYYDKGENDILSYEINLSIGKATLAIVGQNNVPQMIRVNLKLEKETDLTPKVREEIDKYNHEALLPLKVIYDPSLRLVRFGPAAHFGYASNTEYPQSGPFQLIKRTNIEPNRYFALKNNFKDSPEIIGLFLESRNDTIPENYKFLSLYRILEILFKGAKGGAWEAKFSIFLESFEDDFKKRYFPNDDGRKLKNYIETTRQRCAHGKFIYKSVVTIGTTGNDIPEIVNIRKFLPFLRDLTKDAILIEYPSINLP